MGAFNQEKALVGAFAVIVKSLGTFGWPSLQAAGLGVQCQWPVASGRGDSGWRMSRCRCRCLGVTSAEECDIVPLPATTRPQIICWLLRLWHRCNMYSTSILTVLSSQWSLQLAPSPCRIRQIFILYLQRSSYKGFCSKHLKWMWCT